jgi:hypothetical protein
VLGLRVNYQQHDLGVMDCDDVRRLLIAKTERHKGRWIFPGLPNNSLAFWGKTAPIHPLAP